MSPTIKNILAVILGIVIGGGINMLIVTYGGAVVPAPEGVDPSDVESIKANLHLYEAKHFAVPFLAHALGTLVGAIVAFMLAANRKAMCAYIIGVVFLLGGIAMAVMLQGPVWFISLDVLVAYIPMAWLGAKIGGGLQGGNQ
ncbi:MAG: hypothetical protein AAF657_00125 [Acidobacteriota bacterium]